MNAQRNDLDIFWGEMHPCEHFVQIYGDDHVFLDGLASFVVGALRDGREAAIVIATAAHLEGLDKRLRAHGIDPARAEREGKYVRRLADDVLAEFMVNGWPDDARFEASVGCLIDHARAATGGRVRAFGEMVAILWARGHFTATVQLEMLWTRMCNSRAFRLFCAYPKDAFARNPAESIQEICRAHSMLLPQEFPGPLRAGYAAAD